MFALCVIAVTGRLLTMLEPLRKKCVIPCRVGLNVLNVSWTWVRTDLVGLPVPIRFTMCTFLTLFCIRWGGVLFGMLCCYVGLRC